MSWTRALRALQRWRHLVRPHRRLVALAVCAMIGGALAAVSIPWILQIVLDGVLAGRTDDGAFLVIGRWLPTEPMMLLLVAAGLFVGLTALKGVLAYTQNITAATVGQRIVSQLRLELFDRLLRLSPTFHARHRSGDLMLRLTGDISMLREVMLPSLLEASRQALQIAGALFGMLWIDPGMTAVALAVIPLLALTTARKGREIRSVVREQRRKEGRLASTANEALHSLLMVQAYSRIEGVVSRLARQSERSLGAGLRSLRLEEKLARAVEATLGIGMAATLLLGGWHAIHGLISPGELIVFLSYLRTLDKPVASLVRLTAKFGKGLASWERVAEVLEAKERVIESPDAHPIVAAKGEIEFRNVCFGYSPDAPVLRNISFKLRAGETVGLVGSSGEGKSTLLALLLRLYDPQSGQILFDGRDIREWKLDDYRRQLATVLHDPFLFGVSVANNIRAGRADASDEDLYAAARAAEADRFIELLPDRYDTQLGERGMSLSRGQQQRIAIARACLRQAPLLILDEPTTGLDAVNQREVRATLLTLAKQRTCLWIAHDLGQIRDLPRALVLNRGELAQDGDPKQLLAAAGQFRTLFGGAAS